MTEIQPVLTAPFVTGLLLVLNWCLTGFCDWWGKDPILVKLNRILQQLKVNQEINWDPQLIVSLTDWFLTGLLVVLTGV